MANSVEFEEPFRLEAGGEIICAESPGYACPTVSDLDADGNGTIELFDIIILLDLILDISSFVY